MCSDKKRAFTGRDITYVAAGVALMAVSSWVYLPFGPVPFTLQTMAIAFIALALSPRRSFVAVVLYVVLGAVGMPVFSGMQGGIGVLLGPTGGYIWGFVFAMALCSLIRLRHTGTTVQLMCCIVLLLVTHVFGVGWLAYMGNMGLVEAAAVGSVPFVVPDVLKIVVGTSLARSVTRALPYLAREQQ